jgi:hypothetical protein
MRRRHFIGRERNRGSAGRGDHANALVILIVFQVRRPNRVGDPLPVGTELRTSDFLDSKIIVHGECSFAGDRSAGRRAARRRRLSPNDPESREDQNHQREPIAKIHEQNLCRRSSLRTAGQHNRRRTSSGFGRAHQDRNNRSNAAGIPSVSEGSHLFANLLTRTSCRCIGEKLSQQLNSCTSTS